MTLQILSFIILSVPTAWELYNDRNGDLNKKEDVFVRGALMLCAAFICKWVGFNFWASLALSIAIHFAFFDYIIAYILIKNGTIEPPKGVEYHWFTYTGKSGVVDNIRLWREMDPWTKLMARLSLLTVAMLTFF